MSKPFLLLQSRPEVEALEDEYQSILRFGAIPKSLLIRQQIDQTYLQIMPNISKFSGIILGGGPSNVSDDQNNKSISQKMYEPRLHKLLRIVMAQDYTFLGICYGVGLLASYFNKTAVTKNMSEPVGAAKLNY